jgi:hypothetical protein
MPPVDFAAAWADLTSGDANIHAKMAAAHGSPNQLALPTPAINVVAAVPKATLVPGKFGDMRLIVGPWSSWTSPVDYVGNAMQRIAELKNAPAPWADNDSVTAIASETSRGHEIAVGPQPGSIVVVSPAAEAATVAVFTQFALRPPPSAVAIFPKEDGGLRLQTVGDDRAVILDISPSGTEFTGEYAGDDVYHSETLRNAVDAARFIVNSTR